ncbi:O-antigen/teichoic acid export membrane protein [Aminobacter niigataensis]|uniref:O-antigen/teichoic acid export membrane protein n=1 Tax=Aminobacter niigataensis TaxID=83265 RepID=A0ABR6L915_9HYPH|nr:lipopolysaccharide biosynthesis protein [Aminobacter niigataensis]MBB4653230.1 O-antigen/teichoic acid export membrane protein [Aminobacter niigataensis]
MTQANDIPRMPLRERIGSFLLERRAMLRDYFSAVSGSAGRLVFSLIYFVALANTLSIADFGLFATASAAGVMLSRTLAFGFISALYRTATIRPRLIGSYTAGFLMLSLLSLPVLAAASALTWLLFFSSTLSAGIFATVIFAEALLWRPVEVAMIVNNGLGRFGRAAVLAILTSAIKSAAAVLFIFWPTSTIEAWAWFYVACNVVSLAVAFGVFYPRQRLRLTPDLYWRRLSDSIYVAGAEVLFYLQMEFDKLLVLAMGGPHLAGIYAIVMRLVDLTAIPIRTFSMMLVQRMMRAPQMLARFKVKLGIEAGILLVSTSALLFLAVVLHFYPNFLGRNVSEAAPLVGLALFVPALRNLVEYHAELLFARGQTLIRAGNLALLAGLKAALLSTLLVQVADTESLVWSLNGMFALLYLASAAVTYTALRRPAKAI